MNVDPVAVHLASVFNSSLDAGDPGYFEDLVPGENLFAEHMPNCDRKTFSVLVTSTYQPTTINPYIKALREGKFRVIVRSKDILISRDISNRIVKVLDLVNINLDGMNFRYIRPNSEPLTYPASQRGDLYEGVVTYDCKYTVE